MKEHCYHGSSSAWLLGSYAHGSYQEKPMGLQSCWGPMKRKHGPTSASPWVPMPDCGWHWSPCVRDMRICMWSHVNDDVSCAALPVGYTSLGTLGNPSFPIAISSSAAAHAYPGLAFTFLDLWNKILDTRVLSGLHRVA